MGFEQITNGITGGGKGKKKLLIYGGIGVLLFVVFKRGSAPQQQQSEVPLNPEIMDMPYYPTMDQQDLDQQFMNYTALVSQDFTNKFLTINENISQLQNQVGKEHNELEDIIKDGFKDKLVESTKTTTPVTPSPPKTNPAPNPLKPVSAGIKYAVPRGGWNPNSVVDYLKSKGYKNTYNDRSTLASQAGISNYKGTATQNKQLLTKLKALK
jgi:hypothetical protein